MPKEHISYSTEYITPEHQPVKVEVKKLIHSPEEEIQYGKILIDHWNRLSEEEEARARKRYGGLFGAVRKWLDQEGQRIRAEDLEDVGDYKRSPAWRKWVKPALKIAGGLSVTAAMTFTGGVGAVLTPTLFTMGLRETIDGAIELAQKGLWGTRRSKMELQTQEELNQHFTEAKEKIRSKTLTPEEFNEILDKIKKAEEKVLAAEFRNTKAENKERLFRSITSTVGAIAGGLVIGIPFGSMDVDKGPTIIEGKTVLDEIRHRTLLRLSEKGWDFEFLYNGAQEAAKAHTTADKLNWILNTGRDIFSRALHTMGRNLTPEAIQGLVASGATLAGRTLEQLWPHKIELRNFKITVEQEAPATLLRTISGYYEQTSLEKLRSKRSETLKNNPEAILSLPQEREFYLSKQNPEYLKALKAFSSEWLPPMDPQTEIAVLIPAVVDQEADRIHRTLEQYLHQTDKDGQPLDPKRFEILLYANYLDNDEPSTLRARERFEQEVARFQSKHPTFPLRLVYRKLESKPSMGAIRKEMADLMLMRSAEANIDHDFIFISNDADLVALSDRYFSTFIGEFKDPDKKYIGGMLGKLDWNPKALEASPLFTAGIRLMQYIDFARIYLDRRSARRNVPSSGANFAYRADIYAAVGGYNPECSTGEDNYLGDAIYTARQISEENFIPTLGKAGKGTALYTSARRAAAAFLAGFAPAEMWSTETCFRFQDPLRVTAEEDIIQALQRSAEPIIEGLETQDRETIQSFDKSLEHIINCTFREYGFNRTEMALKILNLLGIEADMEMTTNKIRVRDSSRYRQNYLLAREEGFAENLLAKNFASLALAFQEKS